MAFIRSARPNDAFQIRTLGTADPAFKVSDRILFYEHEELIEWALTPKDNILLVLEEHAEGEIIGFLYCKVMSYHWAMLDNSYVLPQHRGKKLGKLLYDTLLAELRARHIVYLTTLIEPGNPAAERIPREFKQAKAYGWYEAWL